MGEGGGKDNEDEKMLYAIIHEFQTNDDNEKEKRAKYSRPPTSWFDRSSSHIDSWSTSDPAPNLPRALALPTGDRE